MPQVFTIRLYLLLWTWWKRCNTGNGCAIDMELKGCESNECWAHVVTFYFFDLTHDLDLESLTSNFDKAVSQEWEGWSTWNERDMSRYGVIPTLWPSAMTLILDFQGRILKMPCLRNGMADWHGTKGMWVDRMLDSLWALAITPSHQQNRHDFADGRKNMNGIFNNYVCSVSHMHPGRHFQNV